MDITPILSNTFKKSSVSTDMSKDTKLRQACADFEAIMLQKMMKMAREGMSEGGLFKGGPGEDIYRSLQEGEMAREMAQGQGMGVGELLYQQILRQKP